MNIVYLCKLFVVITMYFIALILDYWKVAEENKFLRKIQGEENIDDK